MSSGTKGARNALRILTSDDGSQLAGVNKMLPLSGVEDGIGGGAVLAVYLYANGGNSGVLPLHFTLDSTFDPIPQDGNAMLDTFARGLLLDTTGVGWNRARELLPTTDNQAEGAIVHGLAGVMARLQGYDATAEEFDRLRSIADNADAQAALTQGLLAIMARAQGWNGATYDRMRTLSAANLAAQVGLGGQIAAGPGEWAVTHEPAVSAQASVTRAAGAAGVRHVCRSLAFSLAAVAAQTIIYARVRDGATGAGAILWSCAFVLPAGTSDRVVVSGLNLVGSAATAMTFEFSGAPVATNFQTAAGSGFSTS